MKNKGFTYTCHPECGSRCGCGSAVEALTRNMMPLISGSNKRKVLVSVETLSTPRQQMLKQVQHDNTRGFTLAEILITLAIIGVVAALTIPTVSRKIQEQQLKTQFKKVYNTLNLALSKTYFDLGEFPKCYIDPSGVWEEEWYIKSGCRNFYNSLASNLKVMKYCNGNAAQGGCIAEYPQLDTSNPGSCASNAYNVNTIATSSKVWVLQDGTIIFTYSTGGYSMFAVDINGIKKPNKWGYDVFAIDIVKENNQFKLSDISCGQQMVSTGGRKFRDMLKWVYSN